MRPQQTRRLLAQEAARILSEEGRRDYLGAKRKAAERLGLAPKHLPTNREVEEALAAHQRLFEGAHQEIRLLRLRRTALAAMARLDGLEVRAAGPVAGDVATAHAVVELHVFADAPEQFAFRLTDLGLPYREGERRIRWCDGRSRAVPAFAFELAGQAVEALVFTLTELREAPADPADGRPMRRLARRALEKLLETESDPSAA